MDGGTPGGGPFGPAVLDESPEATVKRVIYCSQATHDVSPDELDGFTPATSYPLVNPDLVSNAGVAQTLLKLYAKNRVR